MDLESRELRKGRPAWDAGKKRNKQIRRKRVEKMHAAAVEANGVAGGNQYDYLLNPNPRKSSIGTGKIVVVFLSPAMD